MQTRYLANFNAQRKLATLLLIDDDLISREVMATLLAMNGYPVYTAVSGEAALVLLDERQCAPEVVLLDAQMPGLSGVELIAALRERMELQIYVVSASTPPADLTQAANGFLNKPLDVEDLQQLLLHRRVKRRELLEKLDEPGAPVISQETLAQLRGMMPTAGVREIFSAVVSDLQRRIPQLEAAIERGDSNEVRRLGHAIKGGCGMAGAVQAARLGSMLEDTAFLETGNKLDNSRALLNDLRAASRSLERMLETEFAVQ